MLRLHDLSGIFHRRKVQSLASYDDECVLLSPHTHADSPTHGLRLGYIRLKFMQDSIGSIAISVRPIHETGAGNT